jgi:hypothetical protein
MLFLPCHPSTVIAPAEFACLSLFAMPYCPCLNIAALPLLPLPLLLWLHHHIVPFLFEPLVLVEYALPSVLPQLLPIVMPCCSCPCLVSCCPFCSPMPSTVQMPSTATMNSSLSQTTEPPRVEQASHMLIASVQQPCSQEKLAAFTSTHSGPYGTWACHGTWWFPMSHKPKAAELFLPVLETPGNLWCKDGLALVLKGNGHNHHAYEQDDPSVL